MLKNIVVSIRVTLVLAAITGLVFPLLITGLAQAFFPRQANGSLITKNGTIIGSELIGQSFTKPNYFHSRPSSAGSGYAGEASGGSNLGPTSQKLIMGVEDDPSTKKVDESFAGVKQLTANYRQENNLDADAKVPVDAVTRSASGLDPDISVENALMQAGRVAAQRHLEEKSVKDLIAKHTTPRQFGFLGEPHVNVLLLNMALDEHPQM